MTGLFWRFVMCAVLGILGFVWQERITRRLRQEVAPKWARLMEAQLDPEPTAGPAPVLSTAPAPGRSASSGKPRQYVWQRDRPAATATHTWLRSLIPRTAAAYPAVCRVRPRRMPAGWNPWLNGPPPVRSWSGPVLEPAQSSCVVYPSPEQWFVLCPGSCSDPLACDWMNAWAGCFRSRGYLPRSHRASPPLLQCLTGSSHERKDK